MAALTHTGRNILYLIQKSYPKIYIFVFIFFYNVKYNCLIPKPVSFLNIRVCRLDERNIKHPRLTSNVRFAYGAIKWHPVVLLALHS